MYINNDLGGDDGFPEYKHLYFFSERFRRPGVRQRGRLRVAVHEGWVVQDPVSLHLQLEGQGDRRAHQDLRKDLPRLLEGVPLPDRDRDEVEWRRRRKWR